MNSPHYSVLYQETLDGLNLTADGRYIDGTLGAGGHSYGILQATNPTGQLLGLDADPVALAIAAKRLQEFGSRVCLVQSNFAKMHEVAKAAGFEAADGVVLDIGVSSMQLDDPNRGFSFRGEGPLDMRFGETQGSQTAADIVNRWPEERLVKLFFELGEEPQSRRLARAIFETRKTSKFETTTQLAGLLERVAGGRAAGRDKKPIHPATRIFQALRIEVNQELVNLEKGLEAAIAVLRPGGRLAVISFHSLEDRIVKHFMRYEASDKIVPENAPHGLSFPKEATLVLVTKKPIEAGSAELNDNRRSRSARLRIAQKI